MCCLLVYHDNDRRDDCAGIVKTSTDMQEVWRSQRMSMLLSGQHRYWSWHNLYARMVAR